MSDPALPSESRWDPAHPLAQHAELARNTDLARNSNPRIGMAYAVQLRTDTEPRSSTSRKVPALQTVLSFRLRRVGPDGQLLPPVAVEMRGATVTGAIAEGDLVQLARAAPHGGALKLAAVTNLTTGTRVYTGPPRGVTVLKVVLAVLLSLVAAGLIAVAIFLTLMLAGL